MDDYSFILLCICVIICVILLTLIGIVIYSGLFTSIHVGAGAPPVGSLVVMYKFGKGPYHNCSAVFNETLSIAPKKRTIGFYYDDPKKVQQENLRWAVGSIVAEGGESPDTELIGSLQEKEFKVWHTPAVSSAVRTEFPYTTPLSIFIAIFRVYPALGAYVSKKKLCAHPFMEVYDGNIIHFMAPLAKQDQFYVPEALEKEDEELQENEPKPCRKNSREEVEESESKSKIDLDPSEGKCNTSEKTADQREEKEDLSQSEPGASFELFSGDAIHPTSSRSTSVASSFKTAVDVPVASVDKSVMDAKTAAAETIQDSGVSSTSHIAGMSRLNTKRNLSPCSDTSSSLLSSVSLLDSSATASLDDSSCVSSCYTESSFSEVSSVTEGSTTGTEYSSDRTEVEYSSDVTEVSRDLAELTSDSEPVMNESPQESGEQISASQVKP